MSKFEFGRSVVEFEKRVSAIWRNAMGVGRSDRSFEG